MPSKMLPCIVLACLIIISDRVHSLALHQCHPVLKNDKPTTPSGSKEAAPQQAMKTETVPLSTDQAKAKTKANEQELWKGTIKITDDDGTSIIIPYTPTTPSNGQDLFKGPIKITDDDGGSVIIHGTE
uniref:Uncharacterized protein n=1 Tax=Cacopsylla melanoneura TaxID=428564 RepID=A0A8D8XBI0_9HEMI